MNRTPLNTLRKPSLRERGGANAPRRPAVSAGRRSPGVSIRLGWCGAVDCLAPAVAPQEVEWFEVMTYEGVPVGVGRTALGIARMRAEESRRPERPSDDQRPACFASVWL
jgi:hypothetical protein